MTENSNQNDFASHKLRIYAENDLLVAIGLS